MVCCDILLFALTLHFKSDAPRDRFVQGGKKEVRCEIRFHVAFVMEGGVWGEEKMFCGHIAIDSLEYKPPTNNRSGGKVVNVSTKLGSSEAADRLRFQMSEDETQNLQTAVWDLGTPFPGQDNSRRTLELTVESPALHDFLSELDNKNIDTAMESSPLWFKKKIDRDAVEQMYERLLRTPNTDAKKHTVRVKVKCGDYPTNVYVVESEEGGKMVYTRGTHDDLKRNVKCLVMVETVGLWFMARQFGMSLTATDIIVWPTAKRPTGIEAFTMSPATTLLKKRSAEEAQIPE